MKDILSKTSKYNQQHLFKFQDELSNDQKLELYEQINNTDFSLIEEIGKPQIENKGKIEPILALTINEIKNNKETYEGVGIKALEEYQVGALLLAGGMGTRLGSDDPKGMYNIGKTKDVYIFQRLIENLLEVVNKTGKFVPLFIMTSEKNDAKTKEFLKSKNYFGYNENFINFFVQEMAPCTDFNGKILMESKNRLATSPNGNGGWFSSLLANKDAKDMLEKYNIKWINVFAVDNVLQKIADPVFIGATLLNNMQIGAKVIKKVDPYE